MISDLTLMYKQDPKNVCRGVAFFFFGGGGGPVICISDSVNRGVPRTKTLSTIFFTDEPHGGFPELHRSREKRGERDIGFEMRDTRWKIK